MTEGSRPFGIRRLDVPIFGPFRPIGNSTPSKPAPTATHKRTPTARAAEDARALADLNKRASSLLFDIMVLENRREKAALAAMEEPEHRVIIDRMGNIRGA
ncbi:hypothetical protein [Methanocalculus sp.]|uniref:hypothetical protein n=1 Tax=Methanocalculus sp. TaxID=2004547 RepID=UPI002610D641|nr:hypothetical protein [Methanocalculus sp.]MDG6251675.1 hypothetical protein [Methanocalculus sp.]